MSPAPSLVVLAAGDSSRFGGVKQLAPVTAAGAVITDIVVRRAAAGGFGRAVIVVSPQLETPVRAHLDAMTPVMGPTPIPVEIAVQQLRDGRTRPLGTADAVLAARDAIGGSFAVVNADDLYPAGAFALLARHLRDGPAGEHAMVAFRVRRTLTGDRPVSRAFLEIDGESVLVAVREGAITRRADGLEFESDDSSRAIGADAWVSMNMWGFRAVIFDALARAVADFLSTGREGEVYLPDVVAAEIVAGAKVRVLVSEEACIGLTHEEDLAAVRSALS